MTSIPKPTDLANGYAATYDAWNRLVSLDSGSSATYQYDGLHRRIKRTEGSTTTHYYYNNNWQCVEERVETSGTEDPDPTKQYLWHPEYIDALAVSYADLNADGSLTGTGEGTHYYLHDANYNVTGVLNSSGAVVERYHYSPYGEVTVLDADFTEEGEATDTGDDLDGNSDIGNEFLYTGRRLDPVTGLYYYRNRYYHSQLGRFINRDPIGDDGGMNLYGYAENDPTSRVDAMGLAPQPPSEAPKTSEEKEEVIENAWGAIKIEACSPESKKELRKAFGVLFNQLAGARCLKDTGLEECIAAQLNRATGNLTIRCTSGGLCERPDVAGYYKHDHNVYQNEACQCNNSDGHGDVGRNPETGKYYKLKPITINICVDDGEKLPRFPDLLPSTLLHELMHTCGLFHDTPRGDWEVKVFDACSNKCFPDLIDIGLPKQDPSLCKCPGE